MNAPLAGRSRIESVNQHSHRPQRNTRSAIDLILTAHFHSDQRALTETEVLYIDTATTQKEALVLETTRESDVTITYAACDIDDEIHLYYNGRR